jgi:low affinity Fe/Cu permease
VTRFDGIAEWTSERLGTTKAFLVALALVLLWVVSGPLFHWSNTWQLLINTGTTVATFLMLFLLQASQNADTRAVMRKLDKIMADEPEVGDELVGERTRGE